MSQLQVIEHLESYLKRVRAGGIDGIAIVATKGARYIDHTVNFDTENFPTMLTAMGGTLRKMEMIWDRDFFNLQGNQATTTDPTIPTVEGLGNATIERDADGNVTVTMPSEDDEHENAEE